MTGKPKVSHHVPGNLATTKTGQLLGICFWRKGLKSHLDRGGGGEKGVVPAKSKLLAVAIEY